MRPGHRPSALALALVLTSAGFSGATEAQEQSSAVYLEGLEFAVIDSFPVGVEATLSGSLVMNSRRSIGADTPMWALSSPRCPIS